MSEEIETPTHKIESNADADFVEVKTSKFGVLRFKLNQKETPAAMYAREFSTKRKPLSEKQVKALPGYEEKTVKGLSLCLKPLPQKKPESTSTK